jgi:PAS domain S-box-containing protein
MIFVNRSLETYVKNDSVALARGVAGIVNGYFDEPLNVVREVSLLSKQEKIIGKENVTAVLSDHLKISKFIESIQILDRRGVVSRIIPYDPNIIGIDLSLSDYFVNSINADTPYWSNTFMSIISGEPSVVVSLRTADGVSVGFLSLGNLRDRISLLQDETHARISVIDANGTYIADPDRERVLSRSIDPVAGIVKKSKDSIMSFNTETEGVKEIVTAVKLSPLKWTILIRRNENDIIKPVRQMTAIVLIGITFLFITIVIAGYRILHGISRPIEAFIKFSRNVGGGDYTDVMAKYEFSEFKALSENLAIMSNRIQERESALFSSQERFRNMVRYLPVPVGISNSRLQMIYINRAFRRVFGYSLYETPSIESLVVEKASPNEGEKGFISNLKSLADSAAGNGTGIPAIGEYTLVCKDGSVRQVEIASAHFEAYSYNVFVDITARKDAEREILLLNSELEQKVIERTSQYETTNNALETANRELIESNIDLEHALDQLRRAQSQLIHSEKMAVLGQLAAGIAHEVNTPLGAIISSNDHLTHGLKTLVRDFPEFVLSLSKEEYEFFLDFLERTARERSDIPFRERRELKKILRGKVSSAGAADADSVVDALLDVGVYDDIDSLLPSLSGVNALKIVRMADLVSSFRVSNDVISQASLKAAKVVMALKTYLHSSSNEQMQQADVADTIETVLTLYYNRIKNSVKIIKRYAHVPMIQCYPDRLGQVWTNLINNALQAIEFDGTLELEIARIGDEIGVSVTDNGPGIPDDIQTRIFQPFFTTKGAGEGTGLGLDITRKIVEMHNGRIEFTSEPGKTTFTVYLKISDN